MSHGGDIAGFEQRYGRPPVDFSANVCPLGVPEGVARAVERALAHADRYPDPLCRALRAALAAEEGVPENRVRCGNGAADLIFRAALAARPKSAVLPVPTFSEYEQALEVCGCDVQHHALWPQDGFALTERFLHMLAPGVDMAFLCNPNNPTGLLADPLLVRAVVRRCDQLHIRLVVDECFMGFVDDPAAHSVRGMVGEHPCLLVLDAFTKTHGMAGVRLGYALCADQAFLARMDACGQPWAVSSLAQAAGLAALGERGYLVRARALIQSERAALADGLAKLSLRVLGGAANYLFFYCGAPNLAARMEERGFLLRDCAGFKGLCKGYYRIAVRAAEENQALLRALDEALHAA